MAVITFCLPCSDGGMKMKFTFNVKPSTTVREVHDVVFDRIGQGNFYLIQNGRLLEGEKEVGDAPVQIASRVFGGKGGFGSMLRAIGAQIEKTTNREACRDLSGRRLRDINEEQRLKNWIAQQAAREDEARDRKRKKLEKLLKEPSHNFEDKSYEKERSHLLERVADAFEQGVEAGPSVPQSVPHTEISNGKGQKRKHESKHCGPKQKKKNNLLWIDDLSCSEEDDGSEEDSGSDVDKKETKNSGEAPDIKREVEEEGQRNMESNGKGSPSGSQIGN